jgi:Kef-type K+ transport system membrane component KefB
MTSLEYDEIFTGVPSTYEDLFAILVFFLTLFLFGDVICRRGLRIVPPLVGYIIAGVILGPEGFDFVPLEEAWVLLGNLGLVLLIAKAGLEMDLDILKTIGVRGCLMALVGSILPVSLGMLISWAALDQTGSTVIAMGCCFGPTSAGIAINVLGQCNILDLPIGQLIIAAAIVDDILALLVLSQLQALTAQGDVSVSDIVVPILSAFGWLFVGGAAALFLAPTLFGKLHDLSKTETISRLFKPFKLDASKSNDDPEYKAGLALTVMMCLLFALLPATYYSQASYLLGAFLAGLAFCQEPTMDEKFRCEFKRVVHWLMKLFFAASIGFQVPVSLLSDGAVIGRGFLLATALFGKVAVGPLMTPLFDDDMKRWRGKHLRDCAVVGFSMAGEAEFAFVVAVFGVTEGLIPPDFYASIVLAILMSTIVSPLLLRSTLALFPYEPKQLLDDEVQATDCLEEIKIPSS